MRIAMCSSESLHSVASGGLGVHVTELAAGLERRGHDVHVFTPRGPGQRDYDRIHGVHYHRVDPDGGQCLVSRMDGLSRSMATRFRDVTRLIGGFDVAHAHDWSAIAAMRSIHGDFGTPPVLTMHSTEYGRAGNINHDGFARAIRDREAAGCHHATAVIAVSRYLAEELDRLYGVGHGKVHVVPNGVNFRDYNGFVDPGRVKARYGIGPWAPTILTIGRMTAQKGMDLLIDAVPRVLARRGDARFVLVGEGPEKAAVVRRAHDLGVAGAVTFTGHAGRQACIDLTRACDFVVVPSRNEPFGIVVLEAWSAGKPVVATTSGGPRDFVWHGVNGLLVECNAPALAAGITEMLADHDRCRTFGANGRRAVEEMFHWDNVARFTEGVYRTVIH